MSQRGWHKARHPNLAAKACPLIAGPHVPLPVTSWPAVNLLFHSLMYNRNLKIIIYIKINIFILNLENHYEF